MTPITVTGLGTDQEPDAVLVLDPTDDGHDATVYFKPRAPRDSAEFYSDTRYGEMWVGRRLSVEELSSRCDIRCAPIDQLAEDLAKNADSTQLRKLTSRIEPMPAHSSTTSWPSRSASCD